MWSVSFSLQGLPKTAYYKMIDYWLIFCLIILIITFAFHTFIGYVLDKPEQIIGKPRNNWTIAIQMNRMGRIIVLAIVVVFNLGFWILAFSEYING